MATTFAHLSDLHFGRIDASALDALGQYFTGTEIDEIIVTGDLTQSGRRSEFSAARVFFDSLEQNVSIIPGNHDAPVFNLWQRFLSPWRRFRKYLGRDPEPITETTEFLFIGLNSARRMRPSLDWSTGSLSDDQVRTALARFRTGEDRRLQILGAHHPFFPEPEAGSAGRAVIPRAPDILADLVAAGVDLLMTGHVHQGRVRSVDVAGRRIILSQAGTASSTRTRGETPSFNLIEVDGEAMRGRVMRYGGDGFVPEKVREFRRLPEGWFLQEEVTA